MEGEGEGEERKICWGRGVGFSRKIYIPGPKQVNLE